MRIENGGRKDVGKGVILVTGVQSSPCSLTMCGSIEVDVWRARVGLFAARIASRLPKGWRKIKKQVAIMLFTQSVLFGGGARSFGCGSNRRETRLLAVLMSLLLATCVMNVSLLLRCGDVETNPGPGRYPGMRFVYRPTVYYI